MESIKILITGATGNIGKELIKYLSAKEIPFKAMARSLENVGEIGSWKIIRITKRAKQQK